LMAFGDSWFVVTGIGFVRIMTIRGCVGDR
jgi:hypothetical protein